MIKTKKINKISVIIPTFRPSNKICKTLDSLLNQSYASDSYSVHVINNGDEKDMIKFIKIYKKNKNIYFTQENKPGSYAARNTGIKKTKSDILAFIDDDCIAEHDWLKKIHTTFTENTNFFIFGGKIEFIFKNKSPNLIEEYDSHKYLQQKKYIEKYNFAATANMFTKREVFEKIGLFNENIFSGADSEWGNRAKNNNLSIYYNHDVKIYHPARSSLNSLLKKVKRVAGGNYQKREKESFGILIKRLFFGFISGIKQTYEIPEISFYRKIGLLIIENIVQINKIYIEMCFYIKIKKPSRN